MADTAMVLFPFHVKDPLTVSIAVPLRMRPRSMLVDPSTVRLPFRDATPVTSSELSIVDGVAKLIEPPDITTAALLSRLLTE